VVCRIMRSVVLPGQPLGPPGAPAPSAALGTYVDFNGVHRASLIGLYKDKVLALMSTLQVEWGILTPLVQSVLVPKLRPNIPTDGSIVIGTVTRLSSQQATLSITVVDGLALPHGEDYTGVIRSQDVRATEKDKIKIGDAFRGGDIVKGGSGSLSRHWTITEQPFRSGG